MARKDIGEVRAKTCRILLAMLKSLDFKGIGITIRFFIKKGYFSMQKVNWKSNKIESRKTY